MPGARGHLMDHVGKQREGASREHGLFLLVVWKEPRAGRLFSQKATVLLGLLNKVSQSHEVAGVAPGYNTPLCMWGTTSHLPQLFPCWWHCRGCCGQMQNCVSWGCLRGAGQLVFFTHPPNPSRIPRQEAVL